MADIDLLQDSLTHAQLKRDSMLNFTKLSVGERISSHRDLVSLSVLLLGGIVTLLSVGLEGLVKTRFLLYMAGAMLVAAIGLSLWVRTILIGYLQQVVASVETNLTEVSESVRSLRSLVVQTDPPATESQRAVAIDKLIRAEVPANLPVLSRLGEHGHRVSALLFAVALVTIAMSLLLAVGVK